MSSSSRLGLGIDRIRGSLLFTKKSPGDLTDAEWFWSPPQYTTLLAWQVGHIAVAQYSLCLRRVRGRTIADESLISDAFIEAFKLGSKPVAGAEKTPPLDEIRRVFDSVHEQSVDELTGLSEADL